MNVTAHMKKKFIAGLFVLIPLIVTIYVIYLVVSSVETMISPVVRNVTFQITGREIYIPGTGFFLFIIITYITGIVASNYMGKRLLLYGENLLKKIPFVKGIYGSVKDMTNAFSAEKIGSFKEVVLAEFPFQGRYAIGFVTRRTHMGDGKTLCSVFIPTTPNPTSGYLIMVCEEELMFLEIPVDDALKHIVSLGTSQIELTWKDKGLPIS
jgi:uncharacterized membrane protein